MKRLYSIAILVTTLFLAQSCPLDSSDDEPEPGPLELSTAPSVELSQMISETPSDFTWEYFEDNMRVMGPTPYPYYSFRLVLSSFQVRNGEVVNRSTTNPVDANTDVLANGISTAELNLESGWLSGKTWVQGIRGSLVKKWFPGSKWSPSQIEDMAITNTDLAEGQTMVVVYAHVAGSPEREVTAQPFGVIFDTDLDGPF